MVESSSTRAVAGSVDNILSLPLVLSTMAGLSTCLGAAVVFLYKNRKLGSSEMAFSLSLAGSVMITVCVVSILPECFEGYVDMELTQLMQRCLSLFVGCAMYFGLSKCAFPEPEELIALGLVEEEVQLLQQEPPTLAPTKQFHTTLTMKRKRTVTTPPSSALLTEKDDVENGRTEQRSDDDKQRECLCNDFTMRGSDLRDSEARRAWRLSMVLFVSLAVHNFPEGVAVAVSTLHNVRLGWTTTLAIAFHNIPEGIAIAIPCLAARPDAPFLAFGLASLSGLAEPLGAAVALILFDPNRGLELENVLAFVAGVMMMVALLDLLPEAYRHMKRRKLPGVAGAIAGMVIMLASDAYLEG